MGIYEYGAAGKVSDFRQSVNSRGGIQQPNRYKVIMVDNRRSSILCYPESITLPQRSFNTVPFSPWGPIVQIPTRREYGECAMSFIIYQDWAERKFLERWMDTIIPPTASSTPSEVGVNIGQRLIGPGDLFGGLISTREVEAEDYSDYSNAYNNSYGTILIRTLGSNTQSFGNYTASIRLNEAYPLTMTPTSLSSEATGYSTFVAIFAFKDYLLE